MYRFKAFGHKNVLAKHRNTIEITKDKELSLKGDCIIAVNSDFNLKEVKQEINNNSTIEITIKANNIEDSFEATINKDFNNKEEIVFRRSNFNSERTLGIHCNKACTDLNKQLIQELKNPETTLEITIRCKNN